MSTRRTQPGAWGKVEKGPNGRGLCRECNVEVPKGRRTFCSDACVHEWSMRTNPGYVRQQVFKRDKGVCAMCGLDTERWAGERRREWDRIKREKDVDAYRTFRENNALFFSRTTYWDADHIVPVVEGGGLCGLENYRTLCIPCHKQVTRELAGRRAERRRQDREAERGIVRLF